VPVAYLLCTSPIGPLPFFFFNLPIFIIIIDNIILTYYYIKKSVKSETPDEQCPAHRLVPRINEDVSMIS
jgi:hypothetical protein